jgi:hypothetical protein
LIKVRLYLDENAMDRALLRALRDRGVDTISATGAGLAGCKDPAQFEHAAREGRVLYTFNVGDFLRLHTEYLSERRNHAGLVLGTQRKFSVGEQLRRLLIIVAERSAESMCNQAEFLANWD